MQGQRLMQQQVACHVAVNVSITERLVTRLRETGRGADRPQSALTAAETALTTVGTHYYSFKPGILRYRSCEAGIWVPDHMLVSLWLKHFACVVWRSWQYMLKENFRWDNGDGPFTDEFHFPLFRLDCRRHINRRCEESFEDACVVVER